MQDLCRALRTTGRVQWRCTTRREIDLTRMHGRTAGWTSEREGRQPWGVVVGGIVERVVCEVFMACNLNVVG